MPGGLWQPFHSLDLVAHGLLPVGWDADVAAVAEAPEALAIIAEARWRFAIVEGDVLRDRLGWFWRLYHGALREFAARSLGYPLFASNRLSSATTLNILSGEGATNDWHRDANAVTGVLYGAVPPRGGDLMLRDGGRLARLRPRPGLFVCFEGSVEHQVDALREGETRLALAMVYHRSATDQPPAYERDVYQLDA